MVVITKTLYRFVPMLLVASVLVVAAVQPTAPRIAKEVESQGEANRLLAPSR